MKNHEFAEYSHGRLARPRPETGDWSKTVPRLADLACFDGETSLIHIEIVVRKVKVQLGSVRQLSGAAIYLTQVATHNKETEFLVRAR